MARGIRLDDLIDQLRAEVGHSTNPAVSRNAEDYLKQVLRRTQQRLWEEYDWSNLKVDRDIALVNGQRYYSVPVDLSYERIIKVSVKYGDHWRVLGHGIGVEEYSTYDSDSGIRRWPIAKWDVTEDTGAIDNIGMFEVWPIPSRSASSLDGIVRMTGTRNIQPMTNGSDVCELDGTLIVLMAAAEIQARQNQSDAQIKMAQAQKLLSRLMNQSSNKEKYTSLIRGNDPHHFHHPREITSVTSMGSSSSGGSGGDGDFIPLTGTVLGGPVTGPIEFNTVGTSGSVVLDHSDTIYGWDALRFKANGTNTGFIFETKSSGGATQSFAFTPGGSLVIPSTDVNNTSHWVIGAGNVDGEPNTLQFHAQTFAGVTIANDLRIIVNTDTAFTFDLSGALVLPRSPTVSDPPLSAVTKAYVDAVIPPGGGEANTASNQGGAAGLVMDKVGGDLPFKTLIGGTDINITEGASTITINSEGGGGVDYIPLSGTLPGKTVTGQIVVEGTGSIHMHDERPILFGIGIGGNSAAYQIRYESAFNVLLFEPFNDPSGTGESTAVAFEVWSPGAGAETFSITSLAVIAPSENVDETNDRSVLTLGWYKANTGSFVTTAGAQQVDGVKTYGSVAEFENTLRFYKQDVNTGRYWEMRHEEFSGNLLLLQPTSNDSWFNVQTLSATGVAYDFSFTPDGILQLGKQVSSTDDPRSAVTLQYMNNRDIDTGDGLTGGGDLSADRTLSVDATVVRTTGTQQVNGIKTFGSRIDVENDFRLYKQDVNTGRYWTIRHENYLGNALVIEPSDNGSWLDITTKSSGGTSYNFGFTPDGLLYLAKQVLTTDDALSAITLGYMNGRELFPGDGISGGGNLSANRTFNVDSTVIRTTGTQSITGTTSFGNRAFFNGGIQTGANDDVRLYASGTEYGSMYGLDFGGQYVIRAECVTNNGIFQVTSRGSAGQEYTLQLNTDGTLWWRGAPVTLMSDLSIRDAEIQTLKDKLEDVIVMLSANGLSL